MSLLSFDHEELLIIRGGESGAYMIVAVHSTELGPSLGGCRMWKYPSTADAARDALRLAQAMTYKAAAAGLNLGGGKGVISLPIEMPPGQIEDKEYRQALFSDFAAAVNIFQGRYITAEDVGTSAEDMVLMKKHSEHVVGLPKSQGGSGDPSPYTAIGVAAAMRAACLHAFGSRTLAQRSVAIIGMGRVGSALAKILQAAGAELTLADINQDMPERFADEFPDAVWVDPNTALQKPVDIVAPCALGGMISNSLLEKLQCRIICGSANNQLEEEGLANMLRINGILVAPDFIANAGGLINVSLELGDYRESEAKLRAQAIEEVMNTIFIHAAESNMTPLAAAYALAKRRMSAG